MTDAHGWKKSLRSFLKHSILFAVLLSIGGFFVAATGLFPIKASSGHWPITEWFLHFSMQRSVSFHTLTTTFPAIDDPALVLKGAGHYEIGCRPCHGSPELHHPRIAAAMTPHPPYLPPRISDWDPEELFYIVHHGVKFTGMPAWPSQQREDESWAVTAFLLKLPELDVEEYRELAFGDARNDADSLSAEESPPLAGLSGPDATLAAINENCARCHGLDGNGRGLGAFPKLAGQSVEYLRQSLHAYASGKRHSGIMEPLSAGLDDATITDIATYYSRLPIDSQEPPANGKADDDLLALGSEIARNGIPDQKVAACADCHSLTDEQPNSNFPSLSGQYSGYLELQLKLFKERHRGGTSYSHLMHPVSDALKPEQMRAVSLYYSSLSAGNDENESNP